MHKLLKDWRIISLVLFTLFGLYMVLPIHSSGIIVKSIAEELEVKPAILNRLIKTCQKGDMNDRREDTETLEELYKAAGLG